MVKQINVSEKRALWLIDSEHIALSGIGVT